MRQQTTLPLPLPVDYALSYAKTETMHGSLSYAKDALVNVAWVNNAATRSLTDVAASCLALAAADRPSAADCEARLCAMYLERSSFLPPISTLLTTYHDDDAQLHTELSFAKKTALEASRGGKTDRDIREARFWSYLFGTPRARERACELWEALPKSDREESSRVLEYVKILARCRGPRERTARTIALLERHAVAVDGLEGGEVAAFIFVCGEGGDDNVAVVQGYMDVLVEQHKAGGGEWVLSVAAPIMLAALDDDAAEWVCPECTVLNAPSLLACNMCGSKRSDDVLAVAVAGGGGCGGGGDKVGVGGAADQSERTCILCNTVNQNENNLNTWLDSINLSHVYEVSCFNKSAFLVLSSTTIVCAVSVALILATYSVSCVASSESVSSLSKA